MPPHVPTQPAGASYGSHRDRVDSPETYGTWREYAFSVHSDAEELGGVPATDEPREATS